MRAYAERRKWLAEQLKDRIVAAGGKGVRVRCGRGTAWGWIDVWCPKGSLEFTPAQRKAVEQVVGGKLGGNCWVGEIGEVERILGVEPFFG